MLEKNKELLSKQAYEYGQSVDWDKYRIVEFAESCYTTVDQVIKWARSYIEKNLAEDEYSNVSKKIDRNFLRNAVTVENKKELEKKYNICESFVYSPVAIKNFILDNSKKNINPEKELDFEYSKLRLDAREYAIKYLGISSTIYEKYVLKIKIIEEQERIHFEKYQRLLAANNLDSIVNALEDNSINLEGLNNFLKRYYDIHLEDINTPLNTKYGLENKFFEDNSFIERTLNKLSKKEYYKSLKKQRDTFLKEIYDYCIQIDFDKSKIKKLAEEYQTEWKQIVNWAQRYAKAYLPSEEFQKLNSSIKEKFAKKPTVCVGIKLPYINSILYNELGKKTYLLWENEYDKRIILLKIFNICKSVCFDEEAIKHESERFGIDPQLFMSCAEECALKYENLTKENFILYKEKIKNEDKNKIKKIHEKYSYIDLCKRLHATNELNEIINIIEEAKKNIPNFYLGKQLGERHSIRDIVNIYLPSEENVASQLMYKINLYKQYMENLNNNKTIEEQNNINNERKLHLAQAIIKKYIDDEDLLVDDFCNKYEIDRNEFYKYLGIIKKQDINLWNLYNSKTEKVKKKIYAILHQKIDQITKNIKFGIEENGIRRPFNILDYYLITNMTAKEMLYICQNSIPENELWIIEKFFEENKDGMSHNENEKRNILKETHIVDCQLDENNELMIETGRVFTDEEKMMIFNYLSSNKIPINLKTYGLAYKKYLDGTLEINSHKKSK